LALEPLEKAMLIAQGMDKRRALDIMVLDMQQLMSVTSYFVICHGRSQTHVDAIGQSIIEHMLENDARVDHREGGRGAVWNILDYGSAVAHVFTEEGRDFYDLERFWEDAPVIEHARSETLDSEPEDTAQP